MAMPTTQYLSDCVISQVLNLPLVFTAHVAYQNDTSAWPSSGGILLEELGRRFEKQRDALTMA